MRPSLWYLGLGLAAALWTAGCGTSDREAAAVTTAERFSAAVERADTATGCALLAGSTRQEVERAGDGACASALGAEQLPPVGRIERVEVYGDQAQVQGATDTLFLTDLSGHWQVVAAGCERRADAPYDCAVKGG